MIKPELMQCYLEINTEVCDTVDQARTDLTAKIKTVEDVADQLGLGLFWTGTHPFSPWKEQKVTPNERSAMPLPRPKSPRTRRSISKTLSLPVPATFGNKQRHADTTTSPIAPWA